MPGLMRVAFTTLAPFISGAERSLQVTLRHLPSAGVTPVVIGPPGAMIAGWCRQHQIPFLTCPLAFRDKWHPVRWWRSVRAVRALLRAQRIQLVHANQMWCYAAAGAAGRSLGLPRVCHLRDEAAPALLHWCCAAGVEAVVSISRHVARQAEAAWPLGPDQPLIETIINPVELPALPTVAEQTRLRTAARREFGLPGDAVVVGFSGQFREVKGVLELLDMLAAMRTSRRWHLLAAGRDNDPGAPYERLCRERAARPDLAGRVTFAGFLDDVTLFYQAIDIAVVPSREEPMGRIPLEAGAFARPSVAFAVGGLPDVIRDGQTGWLVPPADWAALTNVLTEFLEQPQPEFGLAARAWVEQVADPVRYTRQLVGLYDRLLVRGSETSVSSTRQAQSCERF